MSTPYQTTKPKNDINWVTYHPTESFPELLPAFESSSYTGFTDEGTENYPFRQFLEPANDTHDLLWQSFHDSPLPQPLLDFRTLDNFALRGMPGEPFFSSSFNETDSLNDSPLFETPVMGLLVPLVDRPPTQEQLTPSMPRPVSRVSSECSTNNSPISQIHLKKHKRKQTLSRSKLGCWICRIKHLKCDETKPTCKNCVRFGIRCDYSEERPEYVLNRELRRKKLDEIITKKRRRSQASPAAANKTSEPIQSLVDDINEKNFSKGEWFVYFNEP